MHIAHYIQQLKYNLQKYLRCIYNLYERGDIMFKVQKAEETETRTYRLPVSLLEKLSKTAQDENVSVNSLIVQCCIYALEQLEQGEQREESSFNIDNKAESKKTGK